MKDAVTLKIGGQIYGGWTSVSIERNLGNVSGGFTLGVTERWPGNKAVRRIALNQACQVLIGDKPLVTGWIDDVDPSYESSDHSVTIRGRDRTGDLVDCSAIVNGTGAWNGISIMEIGQQLFAPFGITLSSSVSVTSKVLSGHAIQMGETVWECFERALRLYGVTAMADGQGNVLLVVPGSGPALAELKLGGVILAGSGTFSGKDTFSDYWVIGQFPGGSDTYSDPTVSNGASGHASDPNVGRYRPLIVSVECNTSDLDFLPKRAQWEAAVRSGKARGASIKVPGWRDARGTLYEINSMVRLEDDWLGIHESLLVSGVRFTLDDGGKCTELKLSRLSAFIAAPLAEQGPFENSGGSQ